MRIFSYLNSFFSSLSAYFIHNPDNFSTSPADDPFDQLCKPPHQTIHRPARSQIINQETKPLPDQQKTSKLSIGMIEKKDKLSDADDCKEKAILSKCERSPWREEQPDSAEKVVHHAERRAKQTGGQKQHCLSSDHFFRPLPKKARGWSS